jgi:hypothetical protein
LTRHYLPSEPESTVSAALACIARLDELVRTARARLDDYDRQVRELVP